MTLMEMANEINVYHPIPFPEFENMSSNRMDCPTRYETLMKDYGAIQGKTMYDLCSANCYFGFRFLQEGGREVIAVEENFNTRRFVNALATEHNMKLLCVKGIDQVQADFDIGLYLDTHYNAGTDGYIEHMAKHCKVVYTSACRDSDRYKEDLKKHFSSVEPIYSGFEHRIIYKCL